MFRLIFILSIFVASILIGIHLTKEPGYALLSYQTYTVEMPLWVLVTSMLCMFFIFNIFLRTVDIFGKIYSFIPSLLRNRKQKLASRNTLRGMVEIKEGKWKLAEKHLLKSANYSSSPMLNYLSAARSAQELGDTKKRDGYIDLAYQSCNEDDLAVRFTQIKLYLQNNEIELALASLEGILISYPENQYAIKLLHDAYLKIDDWQALLSLIPKIKQSQIIDSEEIYRTELMANCNMMEELLEQNDFKHYEEEYSNLPRNIKNHEDIVTLHAKYYIKTKQIEKAEKLIIKKLKGTWSDQLIEIYGNTKSTNPSKQLKIAEGFLRKQDHSACLHTALARISYRNKLWNKAKSHYEESLHLNPMASIYAELGELLEVMEEYDLSIQCYKKGIEIAGE